ncbi:MULTISPECIES: aldehyde dehydrogenase family protein [Streptomyces]|jgi:acyl-CoA reductase-like NAD-dependent aldehyde dehydrogenase|uniref:Aldehyde dehydrogenase family protein n=2 Tax=Streptomyces griseoaurantiacus TaxID=68213 RepID=F3NP57_9ACTN|nr:MULTISPECIES: aldehyde dehydrogenase family protein [Streptomyces]GHE32433.1 aldehyde dehydrogenase [Streptomyces griseoaurantiacus]EGG44869.1 aldehyde dehydrogenase family protein [Streptomyces griseoaurantiacus M045]MCF0085877.1 Vanillin dehydrogenase [Streptomyces sp. MH192]MCF0097983.1 Vanillin dehydrogenase [Streptomyces sp. MH191]MDX3086610.1 aldehyde dehydrogenase family protein [Streptomyces sp. ME12-02E]
MNHRTASSSSASRTGQPRKGPSEYGYFSDGKWLTAEAGTFEDFDPWTEEVFAVAARCGRAETAAAITAADRAFPAWARTTPAEKAGILRRAAAIVERRSEELAETMARETGTTLLNGRFQLGLVIQLIEQAAGWAYLPAGEVLPSDFPDTTQTVVRRPLGVVASFTPWNGAQILAWRAILSPLVAGNTVVVKPTELAPVSAGIQVAEILHEAGLPAGVVNVVTHGPGEAGPIADEFFENPAVRCVNFIGSVPTGRMLAERAGAALKRSVMELGGYNPLIVLDDADLDYAVRVAAFSAFFHQGQICLNARTILVHRDLYDVFVERLVAKAGALRAGSPLEEETFIGPLITPEALSRVDERVRDAVAKGARLLTGGTHDGPVYAPTVLADVPDDAAVSVEETFGPVVVVRSVESADEAVDLANRLEYGLTSAIISGDTHRAVRLSERIRAGSVRINLPTIDDEIQAPIGGVRDSGWGRSGPHSLHDFTDQIAVTVQSGERRLPSF